MTNPTNWPNPERPGDLCRPPEGTKSETYHWLDCGYLTPFAWREGDDGAWWSNGDEDTLYSPAQMSDWGWKYVSPCLTPTQISDFLAGERERCAKECERLKPSMDEIIENSFFGVRGVALVDAASAIRNLGAAP